MNKVNNTLIRIIKDKIVAKKDIVRILQDTLSIGKEASYRRLRGDVQFTFSEAVILAKKLGISLDSIVDSGFSQDIHYELSEIAYIDPLAVDFLHLENFLNIMKQAKNDSDSELGYLSNIFPEYPTLKYDNICKFHSLKWLYQKGDISLIKPFHQINFNLEHIELKKNIIKEAFNVKNTCYVWDNYLFRYIVEEILYFKDINLVTDEEIKNLKEELWSLLDELETAAIRGRFENGNKVYFYVAHQNFDATYFYVKAGLKKMSMIRINNISYLFSQEEKAFEKMKEWTKAIKKISTQISDSGEKSRISFFDKQKRILDVL